MPVNGTYYAWEDLAVLMPSGLQFDLQSIEYKHQRESEDVYGQGAAPRGEGRGNWSAEGKLVMKREGYSQFLNYVKAQQKTVYTIPKFSITAVYGNSDQGLSDDQLLRCRILEVDKKAAQGDKSLNVEVPFKFEDIEEDGVSATAGLNLF